MPVVSNLKQHRSYIGLSIQAQTTSRQFGHRSRAGNSSTVPSPRTTMLAAAIRRNFSQTRRIPRRFASTSAESSSSSSSTRRYLGTFSVCSTVAAASYALGSLYPPDLATLISPRSAPPPLHLQDPQHIAYVASLEDSLQKLPALAAARAREDAGEWYEARPYNNLPEERRVNSLTGGALSGPGKLAVPPLIRAKWDDSEAMIFVHVGRGVCGHEGIVHGGLLATLLDETLGRQVCVYYVCTK